MSRVHNSLKNARVSVLFVALTTFFALFSRQVFIQHVGDTTVGMTSTITNILGFLNLAELGLGTAIAGFLYRYLHAGDRDRIRDVVSIFAYLYRIIGFCILGAAAVLALFLPMIFGNSGADLTYVYGCYVTLLSTTLTGYFISYRQTLLSANQKEYVVSTYTNLSIILRQVLQIATLKWWGGGYIEWLAIELVFGVTYGFLINRRVSKTYPWLRTSFARGREVVRTGEYKSLFRTMRQVIPHNLGAFVLFQTDSLLIFAFASLRSVTMYTNYLTIFSKLTLFVKAGARGVYASVGNLVAEGNGEQIRKVFKEFNALFYFLGGVICLCLLFLSDPFIVLWLGEEYILERAAFYFFLAVTYIALTRVSVDVFLTGYVMYKDTWAPLTEAGINLVVSIVLGYWWGIAGVLAGSVVSLTAIAVIWKPYFLHRDGFRTSVWSYWRVVFKYWGLLGATGGAMWLTVHSGLIPGFDSWGTWVLSAVELLVLGSVVYGGLMLATDRGMRELAGRLWNLKSVVSLRRKFNPNI